MLEKGEYVSFANCWLPYYIGGVIGERSALLPQSPDGLRERFALDVRAGQEVLAIDRTQPPSGPTTVPLGVAQFPGDLPSVRAFAEHAHSNILTWNRYDRGRSLRLPRAPDLLVADIRGFFAKVVHDRLASGGGERTLKM
ncbi:hypothetical protein HNP84_006943 [Thermocatellispora tengchongensis]|uniref:Uncharacterized protein n=1 Tax=Thermocatellispora tengchongensis TaxID=1073253 RepID=A0A840PH91_9ACTN|nr:hypothetical protein [Thermocatellispora tengchongensis]MBB5137191.1 hypothetical protein [Thermocatellispora tengchongensis]